MHRIHIPKLLQCLAVQRCVGYVNIYRHLQTDLDWRNGEFVNKRTNIILMGSPGSGKTTVGRLLGQMLDKPVVDIDDHHLEPHWNMAVGEKLAKVGGDRFLEEEGQALLQFDRRGCIVSLTGSNPLHEPAMTKIAKTGIVFYLNCPNDDIIKRLNIMKVDRIVGHKEGASMEDTLQFRQQFYEKWYDVRIICGAGETAETVAKKVTESFKNISSNEGYISTRSIHKDGKRVPFFHTVLKGLAEDGGLYTRTGTMPELSNAELEVLRTLDYRQRALRILEKLIHPYDLPPGKIAKYVNEAYSPESFDSPDIFPVGHLEGNQYLLELFHGPTASFKDGALQLMPLFFSAALEDEKRTSRKNKYLILVATSGDTGGAVLDGFSRHVGGSDIGVMVLYPSRGISQLQRHQMTTMEGTNLKVMGVNSDFDFCQGTVKKMFQDKVLADHLHRNFSCKLSAANSLNWGRLLPQIVYHISGYLHLVNMGVTSLGQHIDVCVPTGNFGNILAAYYAKEMGLPFRRLICASNSNNVLTEFFHTGLYDLRSRSLLRTASPAIDILKSSNLERLLFHLYGNDGNMVRQLYSDLDIKRSFSVSEEVLSELRSTFVAESCSEDECRETVIQTFKRTGYLLDPHTAVAKHVADRMSDGTCAVLISGTAHYAKFSDSVLPFLGETSISNQTKVSELIDISKHLNAKPAIHSGLEKMVSKPVVHTQTVDKNYDVIKENVVKFVRKMA